MVQPTQTEKKLKIWQQWKRLIIWNDMNDIGQMKENAIIAFQQKYTCIYPLRPSDAYVTISVICRYNDGHIW